MNALLGALALLLAGILGARVPFATAAPLGPRLLVSSGTHFLFLGLLLGSHGVGLLNRAVLEQLYPALALGLGWIGFLFGLQLDVRQLRRFPRPLTALALFQAALAFLLFLGLAAPLVAAAGGWHGPGRAALLAAAATACISAPAGVALVARALGVRGRVGRALLYVASLDAVVGIAALQLARVLEPPFTQAAGAVGPVVWLGAAAALGLAGGVLFLWLTRSAGGAELVLFVLGLVVFTAGGALYLGLSPLFVSATAGVVVAKLSALRRRACALMQAWEKPIYVIVLVLAGALLRFPSWLVLPFAAAYFACRLAAKLGANFVLGRLLRLDGLPAGLGAGLVPQGGMSLVMAVSIGLTYGALGPPELLDLLVGAVVLGVVASELVGPLLVRGLLARAGEVSRG